MKRVKMAEIKIEVIEVEKYKVHIPELLKDSKVGEKFVMAYFENMAKIDFEKQKTEQLKQQVENEKHKRKYLYWFIGIVSLLLIGIFTYCACNSKANQRCVNETNASNKVFSECNNSNKLK